MSDIVGIGAENLKVTDLLDVGVGISPDTTPEMEKPKNGRRRKYEDERVAEARIRRYFEWCELKGKPYTVTGLANFLDVSYETLQKMEKGKSGYSVGLANLIKRARAIVAQQVEEKILTDKNPAGAIFWSKALMGWSDQPKQESATSGGISITLQVINQGSLSTTDGKSADIVIDADVVAPPELAEASDTKALQAGN